MLLIISLLFFPWFSASFGPVTVTTTATGAPDGWLGVIGLLIAVAGIVDLAIERFSPATHIQSIGGSRESTRFYLAVAAAVCVALKFLLHIHFNYFGWGFYVTVIVTVALVASAEMTRRAV